MKYDDIISLKDKDKRKEKLSEYYKKDVLIDKWLTNPYKLKKNVVIFKDRTEYKIKGLYHRLRGPAIDYNDEDKDIYYLGGIKYTKEEWGKETLKSIRKMKLRKLDSYNEDD